VADHIEKNCETLQQPAQLPIYLSLSFFYTLINISASQHYFFISNSVTRDELNVLQHKNVESYVIYFLLFFKKIFNLVITNSLKCTKYICIDIGKC